MLERLLSQAGGVRGQVQLQRQLGLVEIAQRAVIQVAEPLAVASRRRIGSIAREYSPRR